MGVRLDGEIEHEAMRLEIYLIIFRRLHGQVRRDI